MGNIIPANTKIGPNTRFQNFIEIRQNVSIGAECYIDSYVLMTGDSKIGDRTTIRNHSVIARGVVIGDDCFISPRVMFNNKNENGVAVGGAFVGSRVFIGTAAVIQHGIKICDDVKIGAMSFVNKDITEPGTYVGIPAKKIK